MLSRIDTISMHLSKIVVLFRLFSLLCVTRGICQQTIRLHVFRLAHRCEFACGEIPYFVG